MKNKENAFTLVELLAVIVVLAIVLIIAVPGVLSIINKTKQKGYDSQLQMIKEATRNYVTADSSKIEWTETSDGDKTVTIVLTELQDNGYLDKKILDPRNKKEIKNIGVKVTKKGNRLQYDILENYVPATDVSCFQYEEATGWDFHNDHGIAITRYNWNNDKCGTDVVIPSQINGVDVTEVVDQHWASGWYAFDAGSDPVASNKKLTSVVIPDTVTYVGTSSFANNDIEKLTIPDTTIVAAYAFNGNRLPRNEAFFYSVGEDHTIDRTTLVSYGGREKTVVLPSNIITIGDSAFLSSNVEELILNDGLKTIGGSAFQSNRLERVTIPDSVTTIGYWAFEFNKLTNLVIGNGVVTIERNAFANNQLTNVTIPDSVTSIGEQSFYGNQLTSAVIGKNVTTIGNQAFSNNPSLASIVIKGKTSLSEFTNLAAYWYSGSPTITFEP